LVWPCLIACSVTTSAAPVAEQSSPDHRLLLLIKVLCTAVGETAADFLNVTLDFGLTGASVATGALLVVALVAQLGADRGGVAARPPCSRSGSSTC
jgi:uncharacterized membrane-anchored protein